MCERGGKPVSRRIPHSVCVDGFHLFHSPVCADGQQTVIFTLQSCSGLQRTQEEEKLRPLFNLSIPLNFNDRISQVNTPQLSFDANTDLTSLTCLITPHQGFSTSPHLTSSKSAHPPSFLAKLKCISNIVGQRSP